MKISHDKVLSKIADMRAAETVCGVKYNDRTSFSKLIRDCGMSRQNYYSMLKANNFTHEFCLNLASKLNCKISAITE